MARIQLPAHGWRPRDYQMRAWSAWEGGAKRSLLVWHRRSGKDEISLHKTACSAFERVATYWHMLPEYSQARKAIWNAINPHSGRRRIDEAFPKELRSSTNDNEMFIRFVNGSTWQVVGSDNYDSLVGTPPAGVVMSEWALSNPSAWGYLAPILVENGGWADFVTTPRGRNHVKTMLDMVRNDKGWFSEVLTVDDTKALSIEDIEQQRKEYNALYGIEAGDALIEQEYYCSFDAAILGAFYGRELQAAQRDGRIGAVPIWPDVAVNTAWDLGVSRSSDTMTVWLWQAVPSDTGKTQIRVVDTITGSGMAIPYYAAEVRKRVDERGHRRGIDWVPHDARVPEMTSSGRDGKAKLRIEVMIECGMKPKVVTHHYVSDGISAVRQILGRCWFDEDKCATGIEGLRQYQTEWDDDLKVFKKTPLANWAAHWADAFRILAIAFRELRVEAEPEEARVFSIGPANKVTLNDLWAAQRRKRLNRRIG